MVNNLIAGLTLLLFVSVEVQGDEAALPAPQPLEPRIAEGLAGNWVKIDKVDAEAITAALPQCTWPIFHEGPMRFRRLGDKEDRTEEIALLRDARGDLAFRWNAPDDLYSARKESAMFASLGVGAPPNVQRHTGATMDVNGNVYGVQLRPVASLDPAVPVEASTSMSYGLILQGFNFGGTHYTLMQFAVDYGYAARKGTAFYVKCPAAE